MSHHESAAKGQDGRMVDRMLFFSDAVFAIVLTLLAIELHPPEFHGEHELWAKLAQMAPRFFAFFISFAFVGLWWAVHMRLTRRLVAFDWLTAVCNLIALCFIALLPFACALFGENFNSVAVLEVYWAVSLATGLSMTLLFLVITRGGGRLIGGMGAREWWSRFLSSIGPVTAFALGIVFAELEQVWLTRFAAFFMMPFLIVGAALAPRERAQRAPA
jgi:uncharacterized membrane protein